MWQTYSSLPTCEVRCRREVVPRLQSHRHKQVCVSFFLSLNSALSFRQTLSSIPSFLGVMPVDGILTGCCRDGRRESDPLASQTKRRPTHDWFWSGAQQWKKDFGHPMHLWYAGLTVTPRGLFFFFFLQSPITKAAIPSARVLSLSRLQLDLQARWCFLKHIHGLQTHGYLLYGIIESLFDETTLFISANISQWLKCYHWLSSKQFLSHSVLLFNFFEWDTVLHVHYQSNGRRHFYMRAFYLWLVANGLNDLLPCCFGVTVTESWPCLTQVFDTRQHIDCEIGVRGNLRLRWRDANVGLVYPQAGGFLRPRMNMLREKKNQLFL